MSNYKSLVNEYLKYATEHPFAKRPDVRGRVLDLPACKKCERVAFRHEGGVRCPICGYEGPAGPPIKMRVKEHTAGNSLQ